jgi:hypothetical protein
LGGNCDRAGGRVTILLDLLFYPEDGGDMFLRNVELSELHGVITQKTAPFMKVSLL